MRVVRAVCVTRLICALVASAIIMTGCTSMHVVPVTTAAPPQPTSWRVSPEDEIRVTLRDGRRAQFTVRAADAAAIIARDGTTYNLTDILTVERREYSAVKTAFLVLGIAGGLLLGIAAATGGVGGSPIPSGKLGDVVTEIPPSSVSD